MENKDKFQLGQIICQFGSLAKFKIIALGNKSFVNGEILPRYDIENVENGTIMYNVWLHNTVDKLDTWEICEKSVNKENTEYKVGDCIQDIFKRKFEIIKENDLDLDKEFFQTYDIRNMRTGNIEKRKILGAFWTKTYRIITLCGSTKFKKEFEEVNKKLTLEGNLVISIVLFNHSGDVITEEQKEMLDDIHKHKIDLADEIFVINVNDYIGESTKDEIEYAKSQGKKVNYLVKKTED